MELMVAIVIVATLASLVFLGASKAKRSAQSASTLNQLRQIGMAAAGWMGDNGNFYPPSWDNTDGANRSYAQVLDPYLHGQEAFRDENSLFIGPNARLPVKVNEYSHPITFSMNRAVSRDVTSNGRVTISLIHASQVKRPADVILMADGCQNPGNLNQANASAYRVFTATGGESGPRGDFGDLIQVGPDEDSGSADGWFRYPNGKCQALMCNGSARSFSKGTIKKSNLWIDVVRE